MRIFINENAHIPEEEEIKPVPPIIEPQLDLLLEGGKNPKTVRKYTALENEQNKVRILRGAMRDIAGLDNSDGNPKVAAIQSMARVSLKYTGD
jgi:hypothetical protein